MANKVDLRTYIEVCRLGLHTATEAAAMVVEEVKYLPHGLVYSMRTNLIILIKFFTGYEYSICSSMLDMVTKDCKESLAICDLLVTKGARLRIIYQLSYPWYPTDVLYTTLT